MNVIAGAAVIFEVEPDPQRIDDYLHTAAELGPHLLRIDGFLENERFRSARESGRLLSLSLWRDERALIRWREHAAHRVARHAGRNGLLSGYRLRVGAIAHGFDDGAGETARHAHADLALLESFGASGAAVFERAVRAWARQARDVEVFTHLQQPQRRIALIDDAVPQTLRALAEDTAATGRESMRLLLVRVLRDYGLTDRSEAPQA
jgi:heme-degrading monooxygenase HmoA